MSQPNADPNIQNGMPYKWESKTFSPYMNNGVGSSQSSRDSSPVPKFSSVPLSQLPPTRAQIPSSQLPPGFSPIGLKSASAFGNTPQGSPKNFNTSTPIMPKTNEDSAKNVTGNFVNVTLASAPMPNVIDSKSFAPRLSPIQLNGAHTQKQTLNQPSNYGNFTGNLLTNPQEQISPVFVPFPATSQKNTTSELQKPQFQTRGAPQNVFSGGLTQSTTLQPVSAQNVGQFPPNSTQKSQNITSMGQNQLTSGPGTNMGQPSRQIQPSSGPMPNMGQPPSGPVPNMGQTPSGPMPKMGQPPPSMGQVPPVGHSLSNMGQTSSTMVQPVPTMGQTPSNMIQPVPSAGQPLSNMGQPAQILLPTSQNLPTSGTGPTMGQSVLNKGPSSQNMPPLGQNQPPSSLGQSTVQSPPNIANINHFKMSPSGQNPALGGLSMSQPNMPVMGQNSSSVGSGPHMGQPNMPLMGQNPPVSGSGPIMGQPNMPVMGQNPPVGGPSQNMGQQSNLMGQNQPIMGQNQPTSNQAQNMGQNQHLFSQNQSGPNMGQKNPVPFSQLQTQLPTGPQKIGHTSAFAPVGNQKQFSQSVGNLAANQPPVPLGQNMRMMNPQLSNSSQNVRQIAPNSTMGGQAIRPNQPMYTNPLLTGASNQNAATYGNQMIGAPRSNQNPGFSNTNNQIPYASSTNQYTKSGNLNPLLGPPGMKTPPLTQVPVSQNAAMGMTPPTSKPLGPPMNKPLGPPPMSMANQSTGTQMFPPPLATQGQMGIPLANQSQVRPPLPNQNAQLPNQNMGSHPLTNQMPVGPPLTNQNVGSQQLTNQGTVNQQFGPPSTNQNLGPVKPMIPDQNMVRPPNFNQNVAENVPYPTTPTSTIHGKRYPQQAYEPNRNTNAYSTSYKQSAPNQTYQQSYGQNYQSLNQGMTNMNLGGQTGLNRIWGTENFDLLQVPNILPQEKLEAPRVSLGQDFLDNANCSPE